VTARLGFARRAPREMSRNCQWPNEPTYLKRTCTPTKRTHNPQRAARPETRNRNTNTHCWLACCLAHRAAILIAAVLCGGAAAHALSHTQLPRPCSLPHPET
jgi:hypothetical protein